MKKMKKGQRKRKGGRPIHRAARKKGNKTDGLLKEIMDLAEGYARDGNISAAAEMAVKGLEQFPDSAEMLATAGFVHEMAGRVEDARQCLDAAIKIDPDCVHALFHISQFFIRQGRWKEAIPFLETLLDLKPKHHWIYLALGTAHMYNQDLAVARDLLEKAVSLDKSDVRAWINLGNTLRFMRQFREAEKVLKRALDIQVTPDLLVALSSLYMDMGDYDRGVLYAEKVLALPQELEPETLKAAAYPYMKVREYDFAEELYRRALDKDPAHADAAFGLANVMLVQGRLGEGWPLYRARFDVMQTWLEGPWPEWRGEEIRGKGLYVCAEQGLGDTIQFARYIPLLKERGIKVFFSFQPPLGRLLECLKSHAVLLPYEEIEIGKIDVDFQTALLELPSLLGINEISQIHSPPSYLDVSDETVEYWRNLTAGFDSHLKIGLVWAGNPNHINDHNRSVALSMFEPLGEIPGVRLFSLQIGEAARQIESCDTGMKIIDLTDKIDDFADTAGLIENLDLVVSVDTATAHLAGALGKPVVILLPYSPDWRWFLDREDSPWYPSATLLRQPEPGKWGPVIEKLVGIIKNWNK